MYTSFKSIKQGGKLSVNNNTFEGISLEDKVKQTMEANAPIEAISPMIYTERKDGINYQYDIRTDKWDIALNAMNSIAEGHRTKRAERMDKPDTNSETSAA